AEVTEKYPRWTLTMLPDFRPYDYRPGASSAIDRRIWLGSAADLKKHSTENTLVISWSPQLGEEYEWLGSFEGCRSGAVFHWIYGCDKNTATNLHRYVGTIAEFRRAMALKAE